MSPEDVEICGFRGDQISKIYFCNMPDDHVCDYNQTDRLLNSFCTRYVALNEVSE